MIAAEDEGCIWDIMVTRYESDWHLQYIQYVYNYSVVGGGYCVSLYAFLQYSVVVRSTRSAELVEHVPDKMAVSCCFLGNCVKI